MCETMSLIMGKGGAVHWKFGTDSHDDLIKMANLPDARHERDALLFARVEIIPRNGSYLSPDRWALQIDENIHPEWWSPGHEEKAWEAWRKWKNKLDKILIYKPIVHPFRGIIPPEITARHIKLLKKWVSVRDSVRVSVGDSVRVSVGDSIWDSVGASIWDSVGVSVGVSVGDSIWDSIWDSVGASVRDSIWDSVGASVGVSVGDSVWTSVWAYFGSFFRLPRSKWTYTAGIQTQKYPYQPAVDLWMAGLVASYDGSVWRLHGGERAEILYQTKMSEGGEKNAEYRNDL